MVEKDALMKEIVLSHPSVARALDQMALNYCCNGGGKISLDSACEAAGLDTDAVLAQLRQAEMDQKPSQAYRPGSQADLIRHILDTHHAFTRQELARLETVLERLALRHGEARAELIGIRRLFLALRDDLIPHLLKEENILFPYILALEKHILEGAPLEPACFGSIDNPLRQMAHEHDAVIGLLDQLRQLTQDYTPPEEVCPSYRVALQALLGLESDLLRHIHLENDMLFPKARELETASQTTFFCGKGE